MPPWPSLSVIWNRYLPDRGTLNGPTSTLPAFGENLNTCTAPPVCASRSSAPAERLVKKRSVTAQPTDVLATSGVPLLCTAKVEPALGPGVLNVVPVAPLKDAVAFFEALIVRVQVVFVPAATQSPPQPRNAAPVFGTAVSVTVVPGV